MTAQVLVVRHGESTWNAIRKWQGQADPPLTERGERQARLAVGAAIEHGPFDAIASSTLQRARRTAEIISEGLAADGSTSELLEADADLAERAAGAWEGLTRAEIEEQYPGYLEHDRRPEGYELDDSVVARASRALCGLARANSGRRLLVVSHGGVIHALERAAFGEERWERLDNLTGRWFDIDPDGETPAVMVSPVGDRIALVRDVGPPPAPPDRGYA